MGTRNDNSNCVGSGRPNDDSNCGGNGYCERQEGFIGRKATDGESYFAALRMTAKINDNG